MGLVSKNSKIEDILGKHMIPDTLRSGKQIKV